MVELGLAYEIVVRRSFADYLWRWLRDAGEEYGCQIEAPVDGVDSSTLLAVKPSAAHAAAN